jgi:hypothetical protein
MASEPGIVGVIDRCVAGLLERIACRRNDSTLPGASDVGLGQRKSNLDL